MKNILVVGGAGYIGSQTVKLLRTAGYIPTVYDNLYSGHEEAVIGSKLIVGDVSDKRLLSEVIKEHKIDAVMNFAGYIDVAESVKKPNEYIITNCANGLNLIQAMLENGVKKIIFSSTAAVYGIPKTIPIEENAPTSPNNPYGLSKYFFEQALKLYEPEGLKHISLRYFNAAGADVDCELGDDHKNKTHLITLAILTALGQRKHLYLYGTDYDTRDGTCIRDYIHIEDLAKAHLLALEFLDKENRSEIFNLGNERGFTNREVIRTVKRVTGTDFRVIEADRRDGDPEKLVASSRKANDILGWKTDYDDLDTIIKTAYNWHKTYPEGFKSMLEASNVE